MSDHPYCKTCECYRLDRSADGTISAFCKYCETCIDVNSRPLFDDGLCYERATRAKLSPEERHRRLSEAGRKGGMAKRTPRKHDPNEKPTKTKVWLRTCDFDVFKNYKGHIGAKTFAFAMHEIARLILVNNPELKPKTWREYSK